MSNKDYKQIILDGLLKKYNNRYAKNIITNRRIILKPKEVYKDYDRNNADILEKQGINEAVTVLTDMGFVTADYLKFSDDIEKIYFSEEKLNAVYEYLKEEYGVIPQSIISKQVHEIVNKYICTEKIVQHYCETDNDMSRIGTLMEENLYNEVLKYMKENNLKLEQEIVSYYLVKDINYTIPPLY